MKGFLIIIAEIACLFLVVAGIGTCCHYVFPSKHETKLNADSFYNEFQKRIAEEERLHREELMEKSKEELVDTIIILEERIDVLEQQYETEPYDDGRPEHNWVGE